MQAPWTGSLIVETITAKLPAITSMRYAHILTISLQKCGINLELTHGIYLLFCWGEKHLEDEDRRDNNVVLQVS